MKYQKSAGIVIYFKDKEIKFLLLKYKDYWGYAKGHIESDEKEEQTALREAMEETSLKNIKIIQGFKYNQDWYFKFNNEIIKKNAVFFLGKVSKEDSDKVKISNEHEDFAWLSYKEAREKMKIKNNKEMLDSAYNFILKFERQKTLF